MYRSRFVSCLLVTLIVTLTVISTLALAQVSPDIAWMHGMVLNASIGNCQYSADGKTFVAGGDYGLVKVYRTSDLSVKTTIQAIESDGWVSGVAISADGSKVAAVGYANGTPLYAEVFDANTGHVLLDITAGSPYSYGPLYNYVALSGDGTRLAVACSPYHVSGVNYVALYDATTGNVSGQTQTPLVQLGGGQSGIQAWLTGFTEGGKVLVYYWRGNPTGYGGNAWWGWGAVNAQDGSVNPSISFGPIYGGGNPDLPLVPAVSPQGTYVLTVVPSSIPYYPHNFWEVLDANGNGQGFPAFEWGTSNSQTFATFSADENTVYLGEDGWPSATPSLYAWPLNASGQSFGPNGYSGIEQATQYGGAAMMPDNSAFMLYGYYTNSAGQLGPYMDEYNSADGSFRRSVPGHGGVVNSVAVSPDGTMVASGGADGYVNVWNAATGTLQQTLNYGNVVNTIAFSADSSLLAVGGSKTGVNVWNPSTGALVTQFLVGDTQINSLAFAPTGSALAVADSGTGVYVLDAVAQTLIANLTSTSSSRTAVQSLAFSPDGTMLVGASEFNALQRWTTSNWAALPVVSLDITPNLVAISPDSQWIALTDQEYTTNIEVRKLADLSLVYTLQGDGRAVNTLAFSPNGLTLLSADRNHSIRVWRLSDGSNIATYTQETGLYGAQFLLGVTSIAFAPNGNTYAYGTDAFDVAYAFNDSLVSLSLNAANVMAGAQVTGTVTLAGAAPPGGATVSLNADMPGITVPSAVTVIAGSSAANFTVSTAANISTVTTTNITGSYHGSSQSASLVVTPESVASVSLSPSNVTAGSSVTATVNLSQPAPPAGVVVTLSGQKTGVTYPASITIGSGATAGTFTIQTTATAFHSATTVPVTATVTSGSSQSATLTIQPVESFKLTVTPKTIIGVGNATATVTLAGRVVAPTGGLTFLLTSDNTAVTFQPATITITAGQTTGSTTVNVGVPSGNTAVTLTAILGTTIQTAILTVNPVLVQSLRLSAASVTAGNRVSGTVTLTNRAPTGGQVVTLTGQDSSVTYPSSITIGAGQTTGAFTISTSALLSSTDGVTVGASCNGSSQSQALTVNPNSVSSLTLLPSNISAGTSVTATVTLSYPAPGSGLTVTLGGQTTGVAFPVSLAFASGQSKQTFTIHTTAAATSVTTAVTITASLANGSSQSATLTLQPAVSFTVSASPATVKGGNSATVTVKLSAPAPVGGLTFGLASSNAAVVSLSTPTITIAAGQTTGTATITTSSVTASTSVVVAATLGTTAHTAKLTVTP